MAQRQRPVTAAIAWMLAALVAGGPAFARAPLDLVPRTVASQTRPQLTVLVVPLGPAAEATAGRVDYTFRQVVTGSGRFELARLPDLLDAENARARESRAEEGAKALAEANKLYNELDTIKALAEADRAIKAYQDTDLTRRMADMVSAWIFKIASLVANGESKAAHLEMERLLVVDPDAQFSPNFFPPEDIAYAERLRKAVKGGKEALEVKTTPSGAEVYVDGRFLGLSPVTAKGLAAGDHFVTVKAPGYSLAQQKARSGPVEITLRKSEAWPRYQAVLDKVKQDPHGPLRDAAAREFGTWAGVDQVILAVVEVPAGASQANVTALRLDPKDGHNLAYARQQLPTGEGAQPAAEAMAARLLGKDDARKGGPITHFEQAGGGGWQKTTGYALLGTGAVLLAAGVVFGITANSEADRFASTAQTDPRTRTIENNGRTYALIADLSYLTGLIAAGTGGYLAFASGGGEKADRRPQAKPEEKKRAGGDEAGRARAAEEEERRRAAEEERRKKEKEEEARRKKRLDEDDLRNY